MSLLGSGHRYTSWRSAVSGHAGAMAMARDTWMIDSVVHSNSKEEDLYELKGDAIIIK
jgi:hypothetical protein